MTKCKTYKLTLLVEGNGYTKIDGEIATTKDYMVRDWAEIKAIPKRPSKFIKWSGDLESTDRLVEFLMDSDKTIIARFSPSAPESTKCDAIIVFETRAFPCQNLVAGHSGRHSNDGIAPVPYTLTWN